MSKNNNDISFEFDMSYDFVDNNQFNNFIQNTNNKRKSITPTKVSEESFKFELTSDNENNISLKSSFSSSISSSPISFPSYIYNLNNNNNNNDKNNTIINNNNEYTSNNRIIKRNVFSKICPEFETDLENLKANSLRLLDLYCKKPTNINDKDNDNLVKTTTTTTTTTTINKRNEKEIIFNKSRSPKNKNEKKVTDLLEQTEPIILPLPVECSNLLEIEDKQQIQPQIEDKQQSPTHANNKISPKKKGEKRSPSPFSKYSKKRRTSPQQTAQKINHSIKKPLPLKLQLNNKKNLQLVPLPIQQKKQLQHTDKPAQNQEKIIQQPLPLPQPQPQQLQIEQPQQIQQPQAKQQKQPFIKVIKPNQSLNYQTKKQIIQANINEHNANLDVSFESSNSGGSGSFNVDNLEFHPPLDNETYMKNLKGSVQNLPQFDKSSNANSIQFGAVSTDIYPFEVRIINEQNVDWFRRVWPMQHEFSFCLCFTSKIKEAKFDIDLVINDEETFFLPNLFNIVSIIVSWPPGNAVYLLPLAANTDDNNNNDSETTNNNNNSFKSSFYSSNWKLVKKVLEHKHSYKLLWNSKPQLKILLSKGISLKDNLVDPKIANWLMDSDSNKDTRLETLFSVLTKGKTKTIAATKYHQIVPKNKQNHYDMAYWACYRTLKVSPLCLERLDPKSLQIFFEMEMKITPILARMEFIGIGFDDEVCQRSRDLVLKKLEYLTYKAHLLVPGIKIQLDSKEQMSDIIYNVLKLPKPETRETKKVLKKYHTTGATHLESIAHLHPFPNIIMEYRRLSHHINNYADELKKYCYRSTDTKMMRIYSTILQTIVPTGRLAMVFPNLQSIAHPIEFKVAPNFTPSPLSVNSNSPDFDISALDIEKNNAQYKNLVGMESSCGTISVKIRNAFLPKEGYVFLSADYGQIEMRILAHFSQDPKLLEIFNNQNVDVFKLIAHQMTKIPLLEITENERSMAKHLCYGILYGMGIVKISHNLNETRDKAKAKLALFKSTYQGLTDYLERVGKDCIQNGFVETYFGRRRYFRNVFEHNDIESAKRKAKNTIPQGTAADISKLAMIDVDRQLAERNVSAELILQVHDELLLETSEEDLPVVAEIVKNSMENAAKLSVPLTIKMSFGKCWGSLQPYEIPTKTSTTTTTTNNNRSNKQIFHKS